MQIHIRLPVTAALAVLAVLLRGVAGAAPPEVASFFPTGVERGQTAEVTVAGNVGAWPPKTWTEGTGLTIEPAADKGKLKVTAAADAPLGIHWIRLINDEGASVPRPLLVGTLAEISEQEPNHAISEAQSVSVPHVVSGKLAKRGDVDVFAVSLQSGQTLVADLLASEVLGSPMDSVLQVCDASGNVLDQVHDTRGLDPRLIFTAPTPGVFHVRLFAFPSQPDSSINFAGGDNYLYRLTLTTGPYAELALPLAATRGTDATVSLAGWNVPPAPCTLRLTPELWRKSWLWQPPDMEGLVPLRLVDHPSAVVEPAASPQSPQAVSELPVTLTGRLENPREVDAVAISGKKGERLEVRVESSGLGYEMDPVVSIVDASGKTLAEDDDGRRNDRDPSLAFSPPADGVYQVRVRDLHGRGGLRMAYVCTISRPQPSFSLSLAAGSYQVAPGMMVEIPVTVKRDNGFKGEIEISSAELPAGITAQAVRSPGEGDASKSVKLVLKAAADAKPGSLRICGTTSEPKSAACWATFESSQGESKVPHRDVWIAVK